MSFAGQHLHIKHIADKIKTAIDQNFDLNVGYLVQKLPYTQQQEVYDGMKHIADDLVVWFLRLSEKAPAFAIQEVHNFWYYIGKLYPELMAAFDTRKKTIVKNILELVVKKHHTQAKQLTQYLFDMGIDWSELHVIRENLEKRLETD